MENLYVGLLGTGILVVLIFLRVPVSFAMATIGTAGMIYLYDFKTVLNYVPMQLYSYASSFSLAALPLFMLVGYLAFYAELSKESYDAARAWFGKIPGGLAVATVYASAMFGAASGSGIAEAAVFSKIAVPEMLDRGYNKRLAVGVVSASAGLAGLIPPSVIMIIYGVLTQTSIGELFIAGILPGVFYASIFAIAITLWCYIKPSYAPRGAAIDISWKARFSTLYKTWGIFLLFIVIIGSIYGGLATADEAAGVGVVVSFILLLFKRKYSWDTVKKAVFDSAKTSAMIFLIIGSAAIFTNFITVTGVISALTDWVVGFGLPFWQILIILMLFYLVLGCLIDPISIMVLTLPVVVPIITNHGASLIWFGVIITMISIVGGLTPPFGLLLFIAKAALGDQVELYDVLAGAVPFVLLMLVIIAILCAFPEISLFLPSLMTSGG